jgi:glutathione S-transferase
MGNRTALCASTPDAKYEIVVKGDASSDTLADCPFSHRALLCIEEKRIPYSRTYVDLDNKPQWLLDINPAGTVPILKDLSTGTWTVGSDVVSDLLESVQPEPHVGTVEGSPDVAGSLLGAFKGFLNAEGEEESKEKEGALRAVLKELDEFLRGKAYIGGESVCQTDFLVMPRLYHMKVACKHFRGWEMGEGEYENVKAYMQRFMERDSWKNTLYGEDLVIKGWERHGAKRAIS